MSTMTMNMSQGNISHEELVTAEYDDEVMCSGWNPVVALSQLVDKDKHIAFPAELANVDIEKFLKKMYG